jgi:lipoprotein-anchoring transpeptidase ErfK/SrfK
MVWISLINPLSSVHWNVFFLASFPSPPSVMKKFTPLMVFLFILSSAFAVEERQPHTLGAERDAAVRLQIFLDEKLFGPGFIDGKPGTFTKRAIAAYNRSLGRPEDDIVTLQQEADLSVRHTYVAAVVPDDASRFVDHSLSYKREAQAEERTLGYRSYYEYMAERYHTSEDVLYELNGQKTTWEISPGRPLIVPNVSPFRIEDIKPGRMYNADENGLSERKVIIDTVEKQVQIYQAADVTLVSNGDVAIQQTSEPLYHLVASFPTTPGQERYIHRGTWTLKNTVEWPTWRYDKKMLKEGKRGKEALNIPGGPNNPVGVVWAGLSKSGIGIHGTDSPRTIGRARSSGCYRLANWDAARLPGLIRPGATVIVK